MNQLRAMLFHEDNNDKPKEKSVSYNVDSERLSLNLKSEKNSTQATASSSFDIPLSNSGSQTKNSIRFQRKKSVRRQTARMKAASKAAQFLQRTRTGMIML